ncbi:hypothetical protein EBZ80_22260 [bacterium]|nr:hypothetical protein [bacterium]
MRIWTGIFACSHCGRRDPVGWRGLCGMCVEAVLAQRAVGPWPAVTRLFDYGGEARELIVRSKSRGGAAQLAGCVDLFLSQARTGEAAAWCDAVAAAPASFWTRIRGRPHLATELAWAMARRHGKPVIHVVPPVFWRFRKQAMKSRVEREDRRWSGDARFRVVVRRRARERKRDGTSGTRRILLIDDVLTTGGTLRLVERVLRAKFPGADIEWLVLGGVARNLCRELVPGRVETGGACPAADDSMRSSNLNIK